MTDDSIPDKTKAAALRETARKWRDDPDFVCWCSCATPRAVSPMDRDDLTLEEQLVAALALALHDAHPVYGNTAGWRGGIGGQALTPSCSIIDPPPQDVGWTQGDVLSTPLRAWLAEHPEFDLEAAKESVKELVRWDVKTGGEPDGS